MIELIKKNWNYVLYKNQGEYILSVVCGTVGLYEIEVKLNSEQRLNYENEDEGFIDELAQKIRDNPILYSKGSI